MLKYFVLSILCFILPFFIAYPSPAPEQAATVLPGTVVSDEGYSTFVAAQNKLEAGDTRGMGTSEVERPDGGKDRYYSSGPTEEEKTKPHQEEKEKTEKSMDLLKNIFIAPQKKEPVAPAK
jgi:hypothetical protein